MDRAQFTVLMSVYAGEEAKYLEQSLQSIFSQTLRASEVLLLEDGLLTDALNTVIKTFQEKYPELRVIAYPHNRGLGKTLNDGLQLCSNDIVARMDSDDICKPERFEKEFTWLTQHPDYALVGSWIEEFTGQQNNIISIRKVPETSEEILQYAKRRCPVNHPSVMYRKSKVLSVGGYLTEYFPEDYFLWIKMLMNGCKFHNLQESLLLFRFSPDVIHRRGGWKYAKDEAITQYNIYKMGFTSLTVFISNTLIRVVTRVMPTCLRKYIYKGIRKT